MAKTDSRAREVSLGAHRGKIDLSARDRGTRSALARFDGRTSEMYGARDKVDLSP